MLPSRGFFKDVECPLFKNSDKCWRPYCHFKHPKKGANDNGNIIPTTKSTFRTELIRPHVPHIPIAKLPLKPTGVSVNKKIPKPNAQSANKPVLTSEKCIPNQDRTISRPQKILSNGNNLEAVGKSLDQETDHLGSEDSGSTSSLHATPTTTVTPFTNSFLGFCDYDPEPVSDSSFKTYSRYSHEKADDSGDEIMENYKSLMVKTNEIEEITSNVSNVHKDIEMKPRLSIEEENAKLLDTLQGLDSDDDQLSSELSSSPEKATPINIKQEDIADDESNGSSYDDINDLLDGMIKTEEDDNIEIFDKVDGHVDVLNDVNTDSKHSKNPKERKNSFSGSNKHSSHHSKENKTDSKSHHKHSTHKDSKHHQSNSKVKSSHSKVKSSHSKSKENSSHSKHKERSSHMKSKESVSHSKSSDTKSKSGSSKLSQSDLKHTVSQPSEHSRKRSSQSDSKRSHHSHSNEVKKSKCDDSKKNHSDKSSSHAHSSSSDKSRSSSHTKHNDSKKHKYSKVEDKTHLGKRKSSDSSSSPCKKKKYDTQYSKDDSKSSHSCKSSSSHKSSSSKESDLKKSLKRSHSTSSKDKAINSKKPRTEIGTIVISDSSAESSVGSECFSSPEYNNLCTPSPPMNGEMSPEEQARPPPRAAAPPSRAVAPSRAAASSRPVAPPPAATSPPPALIFSSLPPKTEEEEAPSTYARPAGKVRIAHVPNVKSILSSSKNIKPAVSSAPGPSTSSAPSTSRAPPGQPLVTPSTRAKPNAHQRQKPTIPYASDCRIPLITRQFALSNLYEEFLKFVPQETAFIQTLELEHEISNKVLNPKTYKSLLAVSVLRIRKTKGIMNAVPENALPVHFSSDAIPDYTFGWTLYQCYSKHLMTREEMTQHGYPFPLETPGHAFTHPGSYYRKNIKQPSADERLCINCGRVYVVDDKGFPLSTNECVYHPGKAKNERRFGTKIYACCNSESGSEGCFTAMYHVTENKDEDHLTGFVTTPPYPADKDINKAGIYALDCEMVYTTEGREVVRCTLVSVNEIDYYDVYIMPDNPILDYCTRFSGVSEQTLIDNVTVRLEDVQRHLLTQIFDKTILVGHSLENDLKALKIMHFNVVDTSLVFPHGQGLPFKNSLRELCKKYDLVIQDSDKGHCSLEDSKACIHLMRWKVTEDSKSRRPREVVSLDTKRN